MFVFCSYGWKVDHSLNKGKGPFIFRVSGETYHAYGSLVAPDDCTPKFTQLYIYDGHQAITHRLNFLGVSKEVDPVIVVMLKAMLNCENALVMIFKQARQRFANADQMPFSLGF